MEWTTESEQRTPAANGEAPAVNGGAQPANGAAPHAKGHVTQATQAIPAPANTGYEHCPSCGALVGADQRYCLSCGVRRGDPRLPFMDAVVFMDAMKQPRAEGSASPPKKRQRRLSPSAALIAGVGTLLLALGIGVLIGHSGNHSAAAPQPAAPIVIKGGGEEASASTAAEPKIGGASSGVKKKAKDVPPEKAAEPPAEEVLHTKKGVKLPPPTTQLGDKCEKAEAGCNKNGEFDGTFFGE